MWGWSGALQERMEEFQDIDLWEENPGGQAQGVQPTAPGPPQDKGRLVKMSSAIDQGDDRELLFAGRDEIDLWMTRYVSIMGAPPTEEDEPSSEQLRATTLLRLRNISTVRPGDAIPQI